MCIRDRTRFATFLFIIVAYSLFISSQSKVEAAVCTWSGATDEYWSTSTNWDCGSVNSGDELVFPLNGSNTDTINDLTTDTEFNRIEIQWDVYSFTGNPIRLRGDLRFDDDDSSGDVEFDLDITMFFDYLNVPVVDIDTRLILYGNITGFVDMYKQGDGDLELAGNNSFDKGLIIQAGAVYLTAENAINGPDVIVNHGTALYMDGGVEVTANFLELNGFGYGPDNNGVLAGISGDNILNGPIDVFGNSAIGVNNDSLNLTGVISGGGEIYKWFGGTLILSGSEGNDFTGDFYIDDGQVNLNKSSGLALPSTYIVIGDSNGDTESAWLRGFQDDQFNSSAVIDVNSDGILAFESDWQTNNIAELYLMGGRANLVGSTTVTDYLGVEGGSFRAFFGNVSISAPNIYCTNADSIGEITGDALTLIGDIEFSSETDPEDRCSVTNVLQGTGSITINGNGISFTGANTFTGEVTILNGARLVAANAAALGNSSSGTIVESGGVLALSNNINIADEPLTLAGGGNNLNGALNSQSGSNTYGGPITIQGADNVFISTLGDAIITIAGSIDGTVDQNLVFQKYFPGSGYIQLGGANTFTAAGVSLGDVTLRKNASVNIIPDTIGMHLNEYSTFDVNSFSETLGALSGEAGSTISLGNATLTIGANNSNQTFSGLISGNGSITKVGTGIQTFTGNNNYTGTTNISAGTLMVNGQQASSNVNLASTGVLGGSGRVGVITGGGTGGIAPGNSPGILSVTGNVAFANTNSFNVEINGTTVGTQYDQLNVTGSVNLNSALLNVTLGYTPTTGSTFTIVQASGALIGTFNGLPNASTFTVGGNHFRINYGSNSVVLTVVTGGGSGGTGGSEDTGGGNLLAETGITVPLIALSFLVTTTAIVVMTNKYIHKRKRLKKNFR